MDPLHHGTALQVVFWRNWNISDHVQRFWSNLFHRHDKEVSPGDDGESGVENAEVALDQNSSKETSDGKSSGIISAGPRVTEPASAQAQSRMMELEALIFAMAKRQQELALALSASRYTQKIFCLSKS